ncbi:MAG TPA: hypothetical protein VFH50_02595 [Acidimicrobiales bacterium]|nr:hypothetical protein [Acidimicrobiales bacterium]
MVLFLLLGAGILAGRLHHQRAPATSGQAAGGRVTIHGSISSSTSAPGCASGPNVVHRGASVIVLDPNGAVLANTVLGPGRTGSGGTCIWSYDVSVPPTSDYQIQVAGLPPVPVTRDQLRRDGGRFSQEDKTPGSAPPGLDSGL